MQKKSLSTGGNQGKTPRKQTKASSGKGSKSPQDSSLLNPEEKPKQTRQTKKLNSLKGKKQYAEDAEEEDGQETVQHEETKHQVEEADNFEQQNDDDEDFNMEDVEVECASDDDEDLDDSEDEAYDQNRRHYTRAKRQRRQVNDDESIDDQQQQFFDPLTMELPDESDDEDQKSSSIKSKRKQKAAQKKAQKINKAQQQEQMDDAGDDLQKESKMQLDEEDEDEDVQYIDNLPTNETDLKVMLSEVRRNIKKLEKQFFEEEDSECERELIAAQTDETRDEKLLALQQQSHIKQLWCVPLSDDVLLLDHDLFTQKQKELTGGRLFDIITADPPWQLSTANPTRGVAIAYDSMSDTKILDIPFDKLQTDGFLFIWVINNKYRFALKLFDKFGYKLIDELTWVKQTINGKIAKGHGYYLQHAKETCLVGVKGDVSKIANFNIESDVIFSQRRGQSQKPEEIYEICESLVPNGYYLEIFGRRNNLHNGWVTIGNEL